MRSYLFALFASLLVTTASAEDRIQITVRGFIPNANPANPQLIKPIPGRPRQTMLPGPGQGVEWFATNHRTFTSDPDVSSKLETNFILVTDGASARVEKLGSKPIHFSGSSEKVHSETGKTIETRNGILRIDAIGNAMVGNGLTQVAFQAAAVNPFAPPGVSPSVDYSLDLIFDRAKRELKFRGSIGRFPAFEAYASLNGGPVQKLFNINPSGETPWSLYEFGTGIGDRPLEGKIELIELNGKWLSAEGKGRFQLDFLGNNKCLWTEKGDGGVIVREFPVEKLAGKPGVYVVRRPNADPAILSALGFPPAIQGPILAAGPAPSFMTFTRSGAKLKGEWNGLLVIKNAQGKFDSLKQPGSFSSKPFDFTPLP